MDQPHGVVQCRRRILFGRKRLAHIDRHVACGLIALRECGPGIVLVRHVEDDDAEHGKKRRPAIVARCQTASASSSMSCSEVSAAASRFAFRMAGNSIFPLGRCPEPAPTAGATHQRTGSGAGSGICQSRARGRQRDMSMKFAPDRPYADPEKAARKILEIAKIASSLCRTAEFTSRRSTGRFCFGSAQRRPNIVLASSWRSNAVGWCCTTAEPM